MSSCHFWDLGRSFSDRRITYISQVQNNLIYTSHMDTTGLSLHSLKRAEIEMNLIESTADAPR